MTGVEASVPIAPAVGRSRRRGRSRVAFGRVVALVSLAVLMLTPATAVAHPLGNFTINHYTGVRVSPERVTLDHVLDFAEIPAFTERRAIDQAGDANGDVSDAEAAAYAERTCAAQIGSLTLTLDGAALPLSSTGSAILFPSGQAGALTQRLVCPYVATPPSVLAGPATVAFSDVSYSDRIGWREIVVEGDRVAISGSTANTTTSARLTSYPTDLLAEPLRQSSVTFQVTPGGAALAPFFPPELAPSPAATPTDQAGSPAPGATAAPAGGATTGSGGTPATGGTGAAATGGCETAGAAFPGGGSDIGIQVCELVQARDLTPVAIGLSLLAAAFIGALHAVSPGHGKTVMAAYLVGAGGGGLRHAVGLGLTVTVSHTIGVLALGAITTYASSFLPPDKLQLFLGVASGAILLALGVYLVSSRVRELRRRPRTDRPRHAPAAPLRLATAGSGLRLSGIAPSAAVASPSVTGPIARGGAQVDGHMGAGGHGHEHADGHDHPHDHGDDHAHDHAEGHTDDGHAHDDADAHGHADAKDHADAHEHDHADGHTHDGHGHDDHGHGHADDHAHDHADGHAHDHPHADDVDAERSDAERGYHSHGLFRHTHLPEKLPDGALSWRALFALGLSGGLVPSASAVIVLLVSISLGRPGYGVLLTIAFGLGMAVVLIGIGVALVYARGLLERVPSRARFASVARWVPLATALFVLAVGVAITTQALVQLG